jgi:hypothetical protein
MTEDISTQFEQEGCIVIKGVLSAETVQTLRSFFLPVFHAEKTNLLPDAVLRYPEILKILSSRKLVHALTTLLGKKFVVPPYSSVEFNRFGVFHTDTTGAEINNQTFHKENEFRMVTVAVYLQDNNEYGGGIRLAPGTHKLSDPYVELTKQKAAFRQQFKQSPVKQVLKRLTRGRLYDWDKPFREHVRGVDIQSKAGDAVIWDMRMAHRASPPRMKGPAPNGGKVAIFFTCGANNSITTQSYVKYVISIPQNEHLLSQHQRRLTDLIGAGAQQEFVLL